MARTSLLVALAATTIATAYGAVDLAANFSAFEVSKMKSYRDILHGKTQGNHNGRSLTTCSAYSSCTSCNLQNDCGWCGATGTCMGLQDGLYNCRATQIVLSSSCSCPQPNPRANSPATCNLCATYNCYSCEKDWDICKTVTACKSALEFLDSCDSSCSGVPSYLVPSNPASKCALESAYDNHQIICDSVLGCYVPSSGSGSGSGSGTPTGARSQGAGAVIIAIIIQIVCVFAFYRCCGVRRREFNAGCCCMGFFCTTGLIIYTVFDYGGCCGEIKDNNAPVTSNAPTAGAPQPGPGGMYPVAVPYGAQPYAGQPVPYGAPNPYAPQQPYGAPGAPGAYGVPVAQAYMVPMPGQPMAGYTGYPPTGVGKDGAVGTTNPMAYAPQPKL